MSNEVFCARQEIPAVEIADIKLMAFHADLHNKLLRFFIYDIFILNGL